MQDYIPKSNWNDCKMSKIELGDGVHILVDVQTMSVRDHSIAEITGIIHSPIPM